MTRLASLALLALIPGSTRAEEPKPVPTELEGTWREPLRPGEKAADMMSVTFTGEGITLVWSGAIFRGTIVRDPDRDPAFIRFTIALMNGKEEHPGMIHSGLCLRKDDQLFLQVIPHPPNVAHFDANLKRGPAPVTFTLEKLKK